MLALLGNVPLESSAQESDSTPTTDAGQIEPTVESDVTPEPTATDAPTETPTSTATDAPSPTPTSTTTPTSTPVDSPSPTATATSTATTEPTATATSTPSATATTGVSEAATGTIKIKTVDKNGHLIKHVNYALYTDAGDGTPGSFLGNMVDDDGDGYVILTRPPGKFIAYIPHGDAPAGFGSPNPFPFAVVAGQSKTFTITMLPLSRRVITVIDKNTTKPVKGLCFDLTPQGQQSYFVRSACDGDDGADDSVVTVAGLERFTYAEHQRNNIPDYLHSNDRELKVTDLDTTYTRTAQLTKGGKVKFSITFEGTAFKDVSRTC